MSSSVAAAVLAFAILAVVVLSFISLGRPLGEHEINRIAHRRRQRAIAAYYFFSRGRTVADPSFKSAMKAAGEIVAVRASLATFPALAAGLLKGKKNEWVIFGFEKNGVVNFAWLNRGGKVSVAPSERAYVQQWAKGSTTVLRLHNHPSGVMTPSQQDFISAGYFSKTLNACGISFVDFVCCRGFWAQYHLAAADEMEPLRVHAEAVRAASALSRFKTVMMRLGIAG
jgi:hypothetical protein